MADEDLLRPTLSGYRKPPALYGSTGFFLSGFFGGPVGILVYGGANAYRLGRLSRDLPVIVGIVALAFLAMLEMHDAGWLEAVARALGGSLAANFNVIVRAFGLACSGAVYLLHRPFIRAARVTGVDSLSGWVPGFVAVAVGLLANAAFSAFVLQHH